MNTLVKNPTRSLRPITSPWLNPVDRFFRNDFLDLWDGDNLNTIPSMNISEDKDNYKVELAAPWFKKR
jgi:HSP20 family molecular chaperone IbpA